MSNTSSIDEGNATVDGARTGGQGAVARGPELIKHDRRRLVIGTGMLAATLAIGGFVLTDSKSPSGTDATASSSASGVEAGASPAASSASSQLPGLTDPYMAPSTIFPYLEVEGRGTIVDIPLASADDVESERPLLLEGEAFSDALATAGAASKTQLLLDGEGMARAIEEILARMEAGG